MTDFKRSPSKVWWASESVEWREVSESPRSQDSGFSDTEISPTLQQKAKAIVVEKISEDLYKETSSQNKQQNLSSNYQEKNTPDKDVTTQIQTETYNKTSSGVYRNLFKIHDKKPLKDVFNTNQYSKYEAKETTHSYEHSSERIYARVYSSVTENGKVLRNSYKSRSKNKVLNKSAPAVLENVREDENSSRHSLSSDNESELERLFNDSLDSPKHTSTPKRNLIKRMRHSYNKLPLKLELKYEQKRILVNGVEVDNGAAVQQWINEVRYHYEQECMTTLQSKSIAGELNQKIAHLAAGKTTTIRNILSYSEYIEREYRNINSDKEHPEPLIRSLCYKIIDFLKTFDREINRHIQQQYEINGDTSGEEFQKLFTLWQSASQDILKKEVKKLVEKVENSCSELELRATVTAMTSLCLRNENLIDFFTKIDIVPILLILCEKCDGSSMRTLLLRALTTLCCNAFAVRQFEKFSGIQIICDTLNEDISRPEPERSEAVALLAQVTAPWIKDNHSIKNLEIYSRKLIKSLTKFTSTTKCCQNLLLCIAALANLSSLGNPCIKHILHVNTLPIILDAVNRRGPCVSIYVFEQVATLVANITPLEAARQQLIKMRVVAVLLKFLKTSSCDEEVGVRLQQKSIIALSRLCSDSEAAQQVVEAGGVERLIRLCREKNERFSSDTVLVATLATLRKITDGCGTAFLSTEDAQELIEPKLLDSFLTYSTQNESYV